MINKKMLCMVLSLFLLAPLLPANSKEYVFPPMEASETMAQKNNRSEYMPLPLENQNSHSEYAPLPQENQNSHSEYAPLPQENQNSYSEYLPLPDAEQNSATYFKRPDYQFPPLQRDRSRVKGYSKQPMFPPLENPEIKPNYSDPNPVSYDRNQDYSEPYRKDRVRPSYPVRNKNNGYGYRNRGYRQHNNDYGMGNFYNPNNFTPFQNMVPGYSNYGNSNYGNSNYGNTMWNPFTGNINTMPFNNSPSMDYRSMSMPGFFSR